MDVQKEIGMAETHAPFNVLFLCAGNSARSILAEALLNSMGEGRFRAYSAGPTPIEVNPHAIPILQRLGLDPAEFQSKSWDEFARPDAPHMDFIFTVCDDARGEICPVWPGHPITAHWDVPDPVASTGSEAEIGAAFADAAHLLRNHLSLFTALPFASLDRIALHDMVHEIGAGAAE
jgi:arsenate reductase